MRKIILLACACILGTSFFVHADVKKEVKSEILEDILISYNNIKVQVESLIAQEIEGKREKRVAAERIECLIMIESYQLKLLMIDEEITKGDYATYRKKYYDMLRSIRNWIYS